MQKAAVLSVEDDENLQMVIGEYLESDGFCVFKANDSKTALESAARDNPDVVLLDLVLPDGQGLSLLPQIRARTSAAIIVVSGKSETTEKVVCLEMGADDYLTKPFEMRELSARIRAVLRRTASSADPVSNPSASPPSAGPSAGPSLSSAEKIRFGEGWVLDRTQYQLVEPSGQSAGLTTGEFRLLEALVLSANRALSRERLFDLTREGRFDAYDRAIDIQIARIRKKLGDDTKSPEIIKTVRGIGYMFCGSVGA